ncbi:uncharacterized protein FFNC_15671 [Fusarium fujikuroi]|nr:uncharacterized protein FFNC_15671 [Fusarium fujikuroi]
MPFSAAQSTQHQVAVLEIDRLITFMAIKD